MLKVLSAVEVSIESPAAEKLVIGLVPGTYFDNRLRIAVWPRADQVVAAFGTLESNGGRIDTYAQGVEFNVDFPQLRYPPSRILEAINLGAVDSSLNSVSATFGYDSYRAAAVAFVGGEITPVYGGAYYTYTAQYQRYLYSPEVTVSGESGLELVTIRYSDIIARLGKSVVRLDLDPGNIIESNNYIIIYQVESEVVVDKNGAWEKPPNFPNDNNYPGLEVEGPSTTSYFIDKRQHEYGYMNRDGKIVVDRQFVRYEQPYFGVSNYRPDWRLIQNQSAPPGYSSAFAEIPWGDIISDLTSRYTGLQV